MTTPRKVALRTFRMFESRTWFDYPKVSVEGGVDGVEYI